MADIKRNAELRIEMDRFGFTLEYKNPGETDWKIIETFGNHLLAIEAARSISKTIHTQPVKDFPIPGHRNPNYGKPKPDEFHHVRDDLPY